MRSPEEFLEDLKKKNEELQSLDKKIESLEKEL